MRKHHIVGLGLAVCGVLGLAAYAQKGAPPKDGERSVTEGEVPKAALDALKKLAGGAAFTEFAEEIEHGSTFYEGSWKGPNGNVDALVTAAGDLVEIEESVPADQIPAGARAAAQKESGKDGQPTFEKKTMILYEIHYKKDGKGHEMIFTPDGRQFHENGDKHDEDNDDDGDKGEDDDGDEDE